MVKPSTFGRASGVGSPRVPSLMLWGLSRLRRSTVLNVTIAPTMALTHGRSEDVAVRRVSPSI
jgi:hypothetical protein